MSDDGRLFEDEAPPDETDEEKLQAADALRLLAQLARCAGGHEALRPRRPAAGR